VSRSLGSGPRALVAATLLLAAALPGVSAAQIFVASHPRPEYEIGPLFVRATVKPPLGPVTMVDVFWSVATPSATPVPEVEQALHLLWPGQVHGDPKLGPPDPALAKYVEGHGFTALESGRAELVARHLYGRSRTPEPPEPVAGGAPFVTFMREGGPLGLTSAATWIRIPWSQRFTNREWMMDLKLPTRGLIKDKPGTWIEHVFWGERHRIALSFHEVRNRVIFPMYFTHRDRIVRLSEDPAQLIINFADSDHLKIDETSPQNARRQMSETLQSTESVSAFIDRTEGLTPQVLSVQFGYFSGLQAWAPILIPFIAFLLGNLAGPLVQIAAKRLQRTLSSRVAVGSERGELASRQRGVVLSKEILAQIVPGTATYEDVLRLCGHEAEEHESLSTPNRRTLVYRGQRVVPDRRRIFSWLATVRSWAVEYHEVEVTVDGERVSDVQARVRRARLASPEPAG